MIGTIKKSLSRRIGLLERSLLPPMPLPVEVLSSRVVLVGASVAEFWNVEARYPCVSVVARYDFDKTPVLDQLLARRPLPDAVIIKQCAAYFPAPIEPRQNLVTEWLDRLGDLRISPILATVAPVTDDHDARNPGRMPGIVDFNNWIRSEASFRSVPILDIATALRASSGDPHLPRKLATHDGLHLTRRAYRRRLDPILQSVLIEAIAL